MGIGIYNVNLAGEIVVGVYAVDLCEAANIARELFGVSVWVTKAWLGAYK